MKKYENVSFINKPSKIYSPEAGVCNNKTETITRPIIVTDLIHFLSENKSKTIDDSANTTIANSGKKYDILCKLFIYYIAFCIISMSDPIETLTISTRGFG